MESRYLFPYIHLLPPGDKYQNQLSFIYYGISRLSLLLFTLYTQQEDFSNHRDYERKFRTVSANIDMILGESHEQEQQIEKEHDL